MHKLQGNVGGYTARTLRGLDVIPSLRGIHSAEEHFVHKSCKAVCVLS